MSLNDVEIQKLTGGLGRRSPSNDMISGFIVTGVAVVGGAQLDEVYKIVSVQEAIDLGLDSAYDNTNEILVYEHIKEFFRMNPDGELWFILKDLATEYADLVPEIQTLQDEAKGVINQFGIAWYGTSVTPINEQTTAGAIQTLLDTLFANHMPTFCILESKALDPSSPNDPSAYNAPNVHIFGGQNWTLGQTDFSGSTPWETYSAVGTALGHLSRLPVNAKTSWVERGNVAGDNLVVPGINGTKVKDIPQGQLDTLDDNHYGFFRTHVGRAGIYFNDSLTSVASTDDYSTIENVRVFNKAARIARESLLPDLDSPVNVDPDSGQLPTIVVASFQNKVNKNLEEVMVRNNEVSSAEFFIDPAQNILSTSQLVGKLEIVPTGSASKIIVQIGFKNPFNA